ncbi:MAG: DNA polymerase III subunit [bacterium]|nr:DNA polymerase III subunit [bacterium]
MSFKNITGQEVAKKLLLNTLKNSHVAPNYLFHGPEGVGKKSTAIEFVKALNCPEFTTLSDNCDICKNCNSIFLNNNPDFDIVEPLKEGRKEQIKTIRIEQIRNIQSKYSFRPVWLKYRIAIINKAELLEEEAANAFLKILEEPPEFTLFILITSNVNAILPTLKSRCQPIRFRKLNTSEMKNILDKNISDDILELANGSISRAVKLLEPDYAEFRNKINKFFSALTEDRISTLAELEKMELQEIIIYGQHLYKKELAKIAANPASLKNTKSFIRFLDAINTCEKAFIALKQNVNKKVILYWLAKQLPSLQQ